MSVLRYAYVKCMLKHRWAYNIFFMYSILFNVDKKRNSILSPLIVVAYSALSEHASIIPSSRMIMHDHQNKIHLFFKFEFLSMGLSRRREILHMNMNSPNDTQLLFVSFMCCSKFLVWSMLIVAVDLHTCKQSI